MKFLKIVFTVVFAFSCFVSKSQEPIKLKLELDDAIELARDQSVESFRGKNMYLARYWDFRSYLAGLRPQLGLSSDLLSYSNNIIKRFDSEENRDVYRNADGFTNDVFLNLEQAIPWTGGNITIGSGLERSQDFLNDTSFYAARPVWNIGFRQNLSSYNSLKWASKIEPLKFEKAKKQYLKDVETISKTTVARFFGLVSSQINLRIAENNYANADTLYRIAKGRFEIGTITQDELLDLELSLLNSKISLTKSGMDLKRSQNQLNAFLKLDKSVIIECIIPTEIPKLKLNFDDVYKHAIDNNPTLLTYDQQLLEQDQMVARMKSENGFNGVVSANIGLRGDAELLRDVYSDPLGSQNVTVGFGMPLIDWGKRKGKYLMAKSDREVARAEVEQNLVQFEQNLMVTVMEFNLQEEQVAIALKADSTAFLGYDITKKRFYIDKVDVIKLNSARNSLSSARRNYVNALRSYWTYYYEIRESTLYDFENKRSLEQNFDELVQEQGY